MKPDVKIFETAVARSGCSAGETVMVGDRLDNDICPAKSIGMKTGWVKQGFGGLQKPPNEAYEPDVTIDRLNGLLRVL